MFRDRQRPGRKSFREFSSSIFGEIILPVSVCLLPSQSPHDISHLIGFLYFQRFSSSLAFQLSSSLSLSGYVWKHQKREKAFKLNVYHNNCVIHESKHNSTFIRRWFKSHRKKTKHILHAHCAMLHSVVYNRCDSQNRHQLLWMMEVKAAICLHSTRRRSRISRLDKVDIVEQRKDFINTKLIQRRKKSVSSREKNLSKHLKHFCFLWDFNWNVSRESRTNERLKLIFHFSLF